MLVIQAGGKPKVARRVGTLQVHPHRLRFGRCGKNGTIELHRIVFQELRKADIYILKRPQGRERCIRLLHRTLVIQRSGHDIYILTQYRGTNHTPVCSVQNSHITYLHRILGPGGNRGILVDRIVIGLHKDIIYIIPAVRHRNNLARSRFLKNRIYLQTQIHHLLVKGTVGFIRNIIAVEGKIPPSAKQRRKALTLGIQYIAVKQTPLLHQRSKIFGNGTERRGKPRTAGLLHMGNTVNGRIAYIHAIVTDTVRLVGNNLVLHHSFLAFTGINRGIHPGMHISFVHKITSELLFRLIHQHGIQQHRRLAEAT